MAQLGELARLVGGTLSGPPDKEVTGAAPVDEARSDQITFAAEPRYIEKAKSTGAGAVIVGHKAPELKTPVIRVHDPRVAWLQVLEYFQPQKEIAREVHESAVVAESATVGRNVALGPHAVVGERTRIGNDVVIGPGVAIGDDCRVGDGSIVDANVTVYDGVTIGDRVIIHAGCVIGGDGFGYVKVNQKHRKVPHIGGVRIEDDVELGALVAIDRAVCGTTVVRRGTKIDNLVQVAHNVDIGEDSLVVAMTGIAGSARLGDRVTLAGQSGVAGHLEVGSDTVVAARGLVAREVPPHSFVSGFPARPHKDNMRVLAATQRLPDLIDTVKQLGKEVQELSDKLRRFEEETPVGGGT